nr:MAG TPA: hypothetical protein [Caudoviricetes sp.]
MFPRCADFGGQILDRYTRKLIFIYFTRYRDHHQTSKTNYTV